MATALTLTNNHNDPTIQFDGEQATGSFGYANRAGSLTIYNPAGRPSIYLNGRNSSVTLGGADGYAGSLVIKDAQDDTVIEFNSLNGDFIFGNSAHNGSFRLTNGIHDTCRIDGGSIGLGASGVYGFLALNADDGTNRCTVNGQQGTITIFDAASNPTLTISGSGIVATVGDWPDFVFSDNRPLMGLRELETFISKEKRLPDVPAAEDVAANGVNLVEFQKTLLAKIEELTLHILNLNSRLEALEKP